MAKTYKGVLLNCTTIEYDENQKPHIVGDFYSKEGKRQNRWHTSVFVAIRKATNDPTQWVIETENSIYAISELEAIYLKFELNID